MQVRLRTIHRTKNQVGRDPPSTESHHVTLGNKSEIRVYLGALLQEDDDVARHGPPLPHSVDLFVCSSLDVDPPCRCAQETNDVCPHLRLDVHHLNKKQT